MQKNGENPKHGGPLFKKTGTKKRAHFKSTGTNKIGHLRNGGEDLERTKQIHINSVEDFPATSLKGNPPNMGPPIKRVIRPAHQTPRKG